MKAEGFDAVVIGAGMAGSAAAWQLAKDGLKTLLLEQFPVGHTKGSSHGESRIFRFAYPQPHYAKFAMQSKPLWLALEKECGEKLLHSIGGLDFADDPDCFAEIREVASALKQNGAACEELDAKEIRKRYPQWRIPDQTIGVFSPDGGWVAASKAVKAMATRASVLRDDEPVTNLIPGETILIETAKGRYETKRLVIAAGGWANHLLKFLNLSLPVRVTREQPVYFAPIRNPQSFAQESFPIWIHYRKPFFTYGFPMLDTPGVKLAFHHDGPTLDPATPDRTPNPEVSQRLREYLRAYLPDAAGDVVEEVTCLYTTMPSHDFVIDLAPGFPNIAIASPCSGHGFKFATGIGRALADLVQHGKTEIEISRNRYFSSPATV